MTMPKVRIIMRSCRWVRVCGGGAGGLTGRIQSYVYVGRKYMNFRKAPNQDILFERFYH